MKAITILEPWTSLIACGTKKIETWSLTVICLGKIESGVAYEKISFDTKQYSWILLSNLCQPRAWSDFGVTRRGYAAARIPDRREIKRRIAASQIAGGLGARYICRIVGKQVYLFHDEDKWFIERK